MAHHLQPPTQDNPNPAQEPSRIWELHDPYKYAPPKTEGDTWHIVLEPLLRKDRMRCDAWKDEVQNLLIFAGLFSAVATTFVIESYKSLQADPLANLLFVISIPQSNSSTVNIPPFVPTPSSIRINIFWFMSLVLSLTTVLVGIVSLQWLREHQSYPDLTPKQIFALFHMRSEGLQRWHVPRIFSALPLLLQAALILFFAGMIDFLLSLQKIVAIPIIIIIGMTSVFLVATTIIPTIQGIPFYFPFFYSASEHPPSQCPYKSPQSHAFRTISQFAFRGFSYLLPIIYALPQKLRSKSLRPGNISKHHIIPSIASTWNDQPWVKFDLAWLTIRDAYMQGIYDRGSDLYLHRRKWNSELPLYDIAKGLRDVVEFEGHNSLHTDTFLAAVHYCFEEMSLSIMDRKKAFNDPSDGFGNQERRNKYFRRVIEGGKDNRKNPTGPAPTLSDFLYLNDGWGLRSWEAWEVLHHENMLVFLSQVVLARHRSSILSMHAMELQTRMVRDLLGKPRKIKADWDELDRQRKIPQSLLMDYSGFKDELSKCTSLDSQAEFCYQYANIVKSFFWAVANSTVDLNQSLDTFLTHPQMSVLVTEAGWISAYVTNLFHKILDDEGRPRQHREPTSSTGVNANSFAQHMFHVFVANITFIGEQLELEMREMDSEPDGVTIPTQDYSAAPSFLRYVDVSHPQAGTSNTSFHRHPQSHTQDDPYEMAPILSTEQLHTQSPSLLFYVACLYIQPLMQQHHEDQSPMSKALSDLKSIMRRYYYKRIIPLRRHHPAAATVHPFEPSSSIPRSFMSSNLALLDRSRTRETENWRHEARTLTALEDRWSGPEEYGVERFSEEWWKFILLDDNRTMAM